MASVTGIVIGRNEGARLVACLRSLMPLVDQVIYVDSGSDDGSLEAAQALGAEAIALDLSVPFTAARARNAGVAHLVEQDAHPDFVQFVDGDCTVDPGWIDIAVAAMQEHPKAAVVCGRRREMHPDASLYNRLIDQEWDTPVGLAKSCGGDALMRWSAFHAVDGFNDSLIAGEEPELCVRLRAAGYEIWRMESEMTRHDAAITRFGQWWKRALRGGHAYAEGHALHGASPERHKARELRRALGWGVALPLITLLGAALTHWALFLLLAWPAQVMRLRLKRKDWAGTFFLTLAKLPEGWGALTYYWRHLRGKAARLIEYK